MTRSDKELQTPTDAISVKRFLFYVFGVAGAGGAFLGLIGGLMDWSEGVSFAVCVIGGAIVSMTALRENPAEWIGLGRARRSKHHA